MTSDLDLLTDGADPFPEDGPFGAVVTGAERVAQRVGYELGLSTDSVAGRDAGTGLMAATIGANTLVDVTSAFAAAARLVLDRLVAAETDATPDDERVTAILLEDYQAGGGVITLSVRVQTMNAPPEAVTVTLVVPEGD